MTAEPWINTTDIGLRSDIETLSDIGVITTPITTYPLIWAGIIRDLDKKDIREVPKQYKDMYWRVKSAGKESLNSAQNRIVKLSLASSEQVFRSFGDSSRNKGELTASNSNMNKYFAWNVQVNRVYNPYDQDSFHYDGSYAAVVLGNWIATLGKVEKWWGASWDSANLLSNNAKQPLGISLDRNYAEPIDFPVLNWLGPWSFSGFVGELDDKRAVDNPKLTGVSLTFKPFKSLEASIRSTSIAGGSSSNYAVESDNKVLTGLDFRISLPTHLLLPKDVSLPSNLYFSVTDEDQESQFSSQLVGISSSFKLFNQDWRVYLESTKTYGSGDDAFNTTYEDGFYRTGYRYEYRSIGSTYDSDSKVTTFGLLGNLTRYQSLQLKLQNININQNTIHDAVDAGHTINHQSIATKRIKLDWKYQASMKHQFEVGVEVTDKLVDSLQRQTERVRISGSWSYYL